MGLAEVSVDELASSKSQEACLWKDDGVRRRLRTFPAHSKFGKAEPGGGQHTCLNLPVTFSRSEPSTTRYLTENPETRRCGDTIIAVPDVVVGKLQQTIVSTTGQESRVRGRRRQSRRLIEGSKCKRDGLASIPWFTPEKGRGRPMVVDGDNDDDRETSVLVPM
ncbi:hypothetical protein GALMADRAFT_1344341 [Galerina marginata CBS 339.88]|uniref:Uncharacterized protein n=1 Tax=Galerina marginata (strain CBS 339.88) TaxID=685588 RepID=A0A067SWP0_GALM3|nr:hypothetical protein GALMADRAFT_1344341 [Galerina marginata CBS 339.88]